MVKSLLLTEDGEVGLVEAIVLELEIAGRRRLAHLGGEASVQDRVGVLVVVGQHGMAQVVRRLVLQRVELLGFVTSHFQRAQLETAVETLTLLLGKLKFPIDPLPKLWLLNILLSKCPNRRLAGRECLFRLRSFSLKSADELS